jgi:hypothetical protein
MQSLSADFPNKKKLKIPSENERNENELNSVMDCIMTVLVSWVVSCFVLLWFLPGKQLRCPALSNFFMISTFPGTQQKIANLCVRQSKDF